MKKMRIIDLTLKISRRMPVFPGDPKPRIVSSMKISQKGSNILSLSLSTHNSTHVDAPYHKLPGGKRLDDYDISKFLLKRACKISFAKKKIGEKGITLKDLKPYESLIKKKEAVLIETGHNLNRKGDFPYIAEDAAKFLSKFNLDIVGIDTLSVDSLKSKNKAHFPLLKKNILLLETLVNLNRLPKEFMLVCAPILIEKSDGAPCRAAALF